MNLSDEQFYREGAQLAGLMPISQRDLIFLDTKPKPFIVQISLREYFERVTRLKADRFQIDLCNRLQAALEQRHIAGICAVIHAEAQLGKTTVISKCAPAYAIGNDPIFRYALMMYNETRAEKYSQAVIDILNSQIHKEIFPSRDGWLEKTRPPVSGWMTRARRELNDGQASFNPVGLQSGLTGSGFDWLSIDDPYKNEREAFSETVRETIQDRYDYTVISRKSPHSMITGMFHRYSPEDFAGYLLDSGKYDYWRYATICDGDYVHKETGKKYKDPLGRSPGEYISPERRPPEYYKDAKSNNRVWVSMFQGKPTTETGDFFDISKVKIITPEEGAKRYAECTAKVRAYDHAATANSGDYTWGFLGGMSPDKRVTIFDAVFGQLDPAARFELQKKTAERDGAQVKIRIPQDPASAGKFEAWVIQKELSEFTVVAKLISNQESKKVRASNFARAMNTGMVEIVSDAHLPKEKQWNRLALKAWRDFDLSSFDDPVDSAADMYNELHEDILKGLVIQGFTLDNILPYAKFATRFPFYRDDKLLLKVPANFRIYIGLKISADASLPTCGIVTARAAENVNLGEHLFAVAEYKAYDGNYQNLIKWLAATLNAYCVQTDINNTTVWLHPDSAHFQQTIIEKLKVNVAVFDGDALAGVTETNWYLQSNRLQLMVDGAEVTEANPAKLTGFYNARQEIATWGFNEKGDPNKIAAVLDCLRMCVASYATHAEPLTQNEVYARKLKERLPEPLRDKTPEEIAQMDATPEMSPQMTLQMTEELLRQELRRKGEFVPSSPFNSDYDGNDDLSGGW